MISTVRSFFANAFKEPPKSELDPKILNLWKNGFEMITKATLRVTFATHPDFQFVSNRLLELALHEIALPIQGLSSSSSLHLYHLIIFIFIFIILSSSSSLSLSSSSSLSSLSSLSSYHLYHLHLNLHLHLHYLLYHLHFFFFI